MFDYQRDPEGSIKFPMRNCAFRGSNGVYHTSGMGSNLIWSGTNKDGTISTAK